MKVGFSEVVSWRMNSGAGSSGFPPLLSLSKRDANGGERGCSRYRCKTRSERQKDEREREYVWGVSMATCQGCVWSPETARNGGEERDERRGENYPSLRVRGGWGKAIIEGRVEGGGAPTPPPIVCVSALLRRLPLLAFLSLPSSPCLPLLAFPHATSSVCLEVTRRARHACARFMWEGFTVLIECIKVFWCWNRHKLISVPPSNRLVLTCPT